MKLQKPSGYWNEENTLQHIKSICDKAKRFLSYDDLVLMGRTDLCYTFSKNDGIRKFRIRLGYDLVHKSIGYWTNNKYVE